MREDVPLSEPVKREVLDLEALLGKADAFTLLGIPCGAPPEVAKEAYFYLSRRLHPDRYFRKNLGSFQKRIDRVFDALRVAYQTLSDPEKRAAYLAANPALKPMKWKPGSRVMFNKNEFPLPRKRNV